MLIRITSGTIYKSQQLVGLLHTNRSSAVMHIFPPPLLTLSLLGRTCQSVSLLEVYLLHDDEYDRHTLVLFSFSFKLVVKITMTSNRINLSKLLFVLVTIILDIMYSQRTNLLRPQPPFHHFKKNTLLLLLLLGFYSPSQETQNLKYFLNNRFLLTFIGNLEPKILSK